MTDQDLVAAFLAKKGATVVEAAPAYGIDPAADKARRSAEREAREYEAIERASETYVQRVREERGYYGR